MCDFTRSDDAAIREHARATGGPSFTDRPFGCPPDTVLDLPIPPSVNRTRRIDRAGLGKLEAWKKAADGIVWANGQFKAAQKNINRFELHIVLDEKTCRLNIIVNDSKKHWRRTTIEWGSAVEGVRVTVRPCE